MPHTHIQREKEREREGCRTHSILQVVLMGQQPLDASLSLIHTRTHRYTENILYTEHILDIQAVLTGQEPLDASCEEPLRTARLHAGMMGEEAVTTVTDSSGNHS